MPKCQECVDAHGMGMAANMILGTTKTAATEGSWLYHEPKMNPTQIELVSLEQSLVAKQAAYDLLRMSPEHTDWFRSDPTEQEAINAQKLESAWEYLDTVTLGVRSGCNQDWLTL